MSGDVRRLCWYCWKYLKNVNMSQKHFTICFQPKKFPLWEVFFSTWPANQPPRVWSGIHGPAAPWFIYMTIPGWKAHLSISPLMHPKLCTRPTSLIFFFSYLPIVMYNLWLRHRFGRLHHTRNALGIDSLEAWSPNSRCYRRTSSPYQSLCISWLERVLQDN
jgi:hypothetical protein